LLSLCEVVQQPSEGDTKKALDPAAWNEKGDQSVRPIPPADPSERRTLEITISLLKIFVNSIASIFQ